MELTAASHAATTPAASAAKLTSTVKQALGMLWYEMLSDLNQTGFAPGALGTGGDDFQSMFMWNLAQNDFGKYDTQLTDATLRQLGAAGAAADSPPASMPTTVPASLPVAMQEALAAAPTPATAPLTPVSAQALDAPDAADAAAASTPTLTRAIAYAKQLWPQISAAAQTLGVPPAAILAQSALETGWGAAIAGNNYFGIKAAPGQPGTARPTHEMADGVLTAQTATFRDYPSQSASVADYVNLIQSGYQPALDQNSVSGFATTLQANGYATDNNYAAKIIGISQSALMQQVLQALPQASR